MAGIHGFLAEAADSPRWEPSDINWGVTRASVLGNGDRRFEAEVYLSDGYGLRTAIESRPIGWASLRNFAKIWQPNRLKGVVVSSETGVPFLAAGQVYETRPVTRKWLSLAQTEGAEERFVDAGTLLVSCSGNVGRVTIAHSPHVHKFISHDLLRVQPNSPVLQGWLYAYMRTPQFQRMVVGAHYGHIIKHVEVSHLESMPVIEVPESLMREVSDDVAKIFSMRDEAHHLIDEAEELYSAALGFSGSLPSADTPFRIRASSFDEGRRRFDAFYYNPAAQHIESLHKRYARRVQTLGELSHRIWWPNRFKRVFGDNGTPYVSAEDLFNVNPPIKKRVYAGLIENREDYFLDPGWIVMARSGQIYGLNGSARLVDERLSRFLVSEDLIRIAPGENIRSGYLLCALTHPTLGRPLIIRNAYGTSIPHLEPADISTIPVPRLRSEDENEIAERIDEAARLRVEADELEDKVTLSATQVVDDFMHGGVIVQ